MIFILRDDSNKPQGFEQRSTQLRARLKRARRADKTLTAPEFWRRIRRELSEDAAALFKIFSGKCAFCEAKMAHSSTPHIEHYRPKSRFISLMFTWSNWLLSCGRCNEKKWSHFPMKDDEPCLIDPTQDDPSLHIDFVNEKILDTSDRGKRTIQLLGLQRSPLEDDRARWLMQLDTLLLLLTLDEARPAARQILIWTMQADAPYTAMSRRYLASKVPKLANPKTPHSHVVISDYYQEMKKLIEKHSPFLSQIADHSS